MYSWPAGLIDDLQLFEAIIIVAQFDSFQLLCVGAAFINESEMQYLSCQNSSTTVLILFLYLQP